MAVFHSGRWLGAVKGEPKDFIVTVIVPSKTRDGEPIDHEAWKSETLRTMAHLFRGATAVDGRGAWRDDARGGQIKEERVSQVFSMMAEADWNKQTASMLGAFLRRMGRETDQGEIGILVKGEYFPIQEFNE